MKTVVIASSKDSGYAPILHYIARMCRQKGRDVVNITDGENSGACKADVIIACGEDTAKLAKWNITGTPDTKYVLISPCSKDIEAIHSINGKGDNIMVIHGLFEDGADTNAIREICDANKILLYLTDADKWQETEDYKSTQLNVMTQVSHIDSFIDEGYAKPCQAFNPYLPSWEYVPDGEPYVFGDRVYIYGSHDKYNGDVFCLGNFVCWSAPVDDCANWRYEGVIYDKLDEPLNPKGEGMLYAPDVTVGPDGRYYLYYVCSHIGNVSVAVSDTPAGRYKFYGHVHYEDGTLLGDAPTDEPQFDPGVLTEGDVTYLYTGFCGQEDASRHGAMCTVLGEDMLTVVKAPKIVVPSRIYSKGTSFENHAYFEAASIRKLNGKYIFVYSSEVMHELCYAVADTPEGEFTYGGVVISNCDLGIDDYKQASVASAYGANNHGSIIEIKGQPYVFYHRHTNGTWYSRQVCAEPLEVSGVCDIKQASVSSCGLNNGPLKACGYYSAHIVCNIFYPEGEDTLREDNSCKIPDITKARVVQDGEDSTECEAYIAGFTQGAVIGFKYFDCKNVDKISVYVHGYSHGTMNVHTKWDDKPVGSVEFGADNYWKKVEIPVDIEDGVHAIYFTYEGWGSLLIKGFEFE